MSHGIVVTHAIGCVNEHRIHDADVWGHFAPMFHLVDAYKMNQLPSAALLSLFDRMNCVSTPFASPPQQKALRCGRSAMPTAMPGVQPTLMF